MSQATFESPEIREQRQEALIRRMSDAPDVGGRRAHARFSVELDVTVSSDHNFYAGFAENLSAGGIFIATHLLKPVGSRIELSIFLRGRETAIVGSGEVRWIRAYNELNDVPPGMGIRFIELSEGSQQAIEEFLGQRDPLFFDDED